MNKRKGILEELRLNGDTADTFNKLTIIMQRYYIIYDLDCGTIHSQIFKMLYMSPKIYTYEEVARKLCVSISTLTKYIKEYNALAQKLLKNI